MKKIIAICLAITVLLVVFSGCSNPSVTADNGKISIVTTIFPIYDWAREIAGKSENVQLTMLLDNGVDLHSYQPTADDILQISTCDMFIYVGGESDEWVEDALQEAVNKDMVVINLLDVLGDKVKEEELVEGMQAEEDDEGKEEPEYDEHVWLSLKSTQALCEYISEKLGEIDADNKAAYETNTANYLEKLRALDAEYQAAVDKASVRTILFGDRFPFRYLADDYGLAYYAAFVGCSAETEASFETVIFLANKIDELQLDTIFKIEGSDGSIANAIRNATKSKNQEILTLNSIQSVTSDDVADGTTYLSLMQSNLEVLKRALQ